MLIFIQQVEISTEGQLIKLIDKVCTFVYRVSTKTELCIIDKPMTHENFHGAESGWQITGDL